MRVRVCIATGSPAPPPQSASSRRALAAAGRPPGSQNGLLVTGSAPPRAARGRTAGCTAYDAPKRGGTPCLTSRQAMACEGSGRTDRTNRQGRHCSAGVGISSRWWAQDMVVRSLRRHCPAITAKNTPMRIPRQTCHCFHSKAATRSTRKLPLIPWQSCHRFHAKVATDSTGSLPPLKGSWSEPRR